MGLTVTGDSKRWPDATIPFTFDSSLSSAMQATIQTAMTYWESRTQVSFVKRNKEKGFIEFSLDDSLKAAGGNTSYLGYHKAKTKIKLVTGFSADTVMHEIGHAIGLAHEQMRPDRDDYVCVYDSNIPGNQKGDYNKVSGGGYATFEKYDYFSTMHYYEGYGSEEVKNKLGRAIDIPGYYESSGFLSRGDVRGGRRILPSNVHMHLMDRIAKIGNKIYDANISPGWEKIREYTVSTGTYLMMYSDDSGSYRIKKFNSDGTLDSTILFHGTMDAGITSMLFYSDSSGTFCVTHNNSSQTIKLFSMNSDGSLGSLASSLNAKQQYSYVLSYLVGSSHFLMFYDNSSGDADFYRTATGGNLGTWVDDDLDIGKDQSLLSAFTAGGLPYLFAYNGSTGEANVYAFSTDANCRMGSIKYLHNKYYWTKGWTSCTILSSTDGVQLFLMKKGDGTVHVNRLYDYDNLDASGKSQSHEAGVGDMTEEHDWTSGWTTSRAFTIGSKQFLLLYKKDSGNFHVNEVNEVRAIGEETQRYEWSDGWSSVQTYQVGNKNFLFLLKKSNGVVHVHKMNSDGSVGSKVEDHNWSSGWTKVRFYEAGGDTFLFLLKEGDGTVHIHRMNSDGSVGSKVEDHNWSSGWTSAEFYTIGNAVAKTSKTFLFLLKMSGNGSDGHNVHIQEVNSDGTIGSRVENHDWSEGWTKVRFYRCGTKLFLFLLKKGTGAMHIHEINNDGKVGAQVSSDDWSSGWTVASFLTIASTKAIGSYESYLLLIKESDGTMHFHQMNSNGSVGDSILEDEWSEGWTHASFYEANGKPYLFISKEDGPHTTI